MAIEVRRDAWGIPHLRAADPRELAYAQGRNAAEDRAWQLESERHRAEGVTARYLGPRALSWDVLARRARLTDTARRCYARLDAETHDWVAAYTDGVTAGLPHGAGRAPEFATVGLAPGRWEPWTPLAVWLSTHLLFAGFPTKLWREEVAVRLGEHAVGAFAADGPGTAGSNGWLVPGDRTATGAPLIAGDPHRFIENPGVYRQIRLSCPEFDVVGLAVPGVPGIAHFGHTGHVAWAITNAMADYQDLYAERLRREPAGGAVEALGPDGWRPATAHTETVEVASGDAVTVEVIETDRGPVIVGGVEDDRAVSLRCPTRAYEDLGFSALPALLRARSVADVDRALEKWVEPVNVVLAADTRGGLLHRVAGRVPDRDRTNMLRVVPAWEPRHAWRARDLPAPRAEVRGVTVMANERGLAEPLGVEFAPPHRASRIRELLEARPVWTGPEMAVVHTDTHLGSARVVLDVLSRLPELGAPAADLRARLLNWDRRMDAGSTDAGAYAALRSAVVRRLAAHPSLAALTDPGLTAACPEVFHPWLELVPRVGFALEGLAAGGLFTRAEFADAVRAAAEAVAAEPPRAWGDTHRLTPWRALPATTPENRPPLSGDHDCVQATSSVPGVTDLSARGPAARYVWDLARREDSLWVVPLGASGVSGDPHYRDQLPRWLRGDLIPVPSEIVAPSEISVLNEERSDDMPSPYEHKVDGFGTVRIAPVDPEHDTDLIHGWVTQERAHFWGMGDADRETVRGIYRHLDALTTHHAYLVHRDGQPVALFQTYDPAADRLGECYDVQPGDLGIHLLLGPADTREPDFTVHLMSALHGFVCSDPDPRRIVVEPDARHDKALARLIRVGFTPGPEVTLPATEGLPVKRARLAFFALTRP